MEKENNIIIEGVTIDENTTPEELMATGKFREHDGNNITSLVATEWIDAFGEKFSGVFHFGSNFIHIELYPKLDIPSPGYPDPDYEKAFWKYSKNVIEKNFNNVITKENVVSSTFYNGIISTFLVGDDGKNECSGGYISIKIRG